MQCLEEGTQKLEEGDVNSAKVCGETFLGILHPELMPLLGAIQAQRRHQTDRELVVQPGGDALPPEYALPVRQ